MGCPLSLGPRPEPVISLTSMDQSKNHQESAAPITANSDATINYKAKIERKLCWSKETPDPIFDLAGCNLKQVPNGVFIQCKILLKTQLLLQDNRLTGLEEGGQLLRDLSMITVLNVARNKFKKLPEDIHFLANLRNLDVSSNELKTLPNSINCLSLLEHLNLANNRLVSVDPLAGTPQLRVLNLSNNPKLVIPCESLKACPNLDKIIYDENDTVDNDYRPEITLDASLLLSSKIQEANFANQQILQSMAQDNQDLEMYQRLQDEKRRELLKQMQCEQVEVDEMIINIQKDKETKRQQLILEMVEEEEIYKKMLTDLLCLKDGPDPELLERERIEQEKLLETFLEQQCNLKRQDVLTQMTSFLDQELEMIRQYQFDRDTVSQQILQQEASMSNALAEMLQHSDYNRNNMLEQIAQSEELQKSAVGALIAKNDARSWGLMEQIKILELELGKVTKQEIERKKLQMDEQLNELANRRIEIMFVLMDLMEQQQQRKSELMTTLEKMEANRGDGNDQYWLMQYQRVLDHMAPEQWLQVLTIDPRLGHLFLLYGVIHCLPFLYKVWRDIQANITTVTDDQLKDAGIKNDVDRYNILRAIEDFINEMTATAPAVDDSTDDEERNDQERGLGSECVICLDLAVQMLFIPCGHLCCCFNCQISLIECPMCRAPIESRIKVIQS